MTIREQLELRELEYLSSYAALSKDSKGRKRKEEPCDIRPAFQRDRDRILHCKAFRRLKQKTQVFLLPKGDHYRTRLTHTLEVSQNARTIAKALRLNEDLAEAIALGHDLGHTPFGHAGERALNHVYHFAHQKQSLRVVERIEKEGRGLNLTWEVRDGILNHQTSGHPHTLEGQVVRISDKLAYINHDMDDAIRGGILTEDDIPSDLRQALGSSCKERLNTLVHDVITNSMDQPVIKMSSETERAMKDLRKFMFEKEKLAFVGDGINDAPVLSRADIGIAMGALGSDAAIEAADVVLMDDDPLKIGKAIRIAKKCMRIVYENIYFAIGVKLICLVLGALGIANMWIAIFADVGVMVLAVLNAIRTLFVKNL